MDKKWKTEKYKNISKQFDVKYHVAAKKYMRKKIEALKVAKPGQAYAVLKSMGARPGDSTDDQTFTLPTHQMEGLTDKQCADKIAEYFAAISNEYPGPG